MKSFEKSIESIILCGGKGTRTKAPTNKVLCYFGTKTALEYCLDVLSPYGKVIIVAAENDEEYIRQIAQDYNASVVRGGTTRFESVKNGLAEVTADIAVIHDGARPFVTAETVERCIRCAIDYGSGIAAVKTIDTVKRVKNDNVENIDRTYLLNIQTPQAFDSKLIKFAYDTNGDFTDDSAVYCAAGYTPKFVEGSYDNKKITSPSDLIATPPCQKIGLGTDFHRLVTGRKLILGGVHIPYERGLDGHSDADVVTHAIMDSLLSAAGLPDIGVLFPCTPQYKDADSMVLLKEVMSKIQSKYTIQSVSAVIMAQAPRLSGYISEMRKVLALRMGISEDKINISATTTEGMGIIKDQGMAASSVCLLTEKSIR